MSRDDCLLVLPRESFFHRYAGSARRADKRKYAGLWRSSGKAKKCFLLLKLFVLVPIDSLKLFSKEARISHRDTHTQVSEKRNFEENRCTHRFICIEGQRESTGESSGGLVPVRIVRGEETRRDTKSHWSTNFVAVIVFASGIYRVRDRVFRTTMLSFIRVYVNVYVYSRN